MKSKKAISAVVATMIFLVLATVAVINYETWFNSFQSGVNSDTEVKTDEAISKKVEIDTIHGNSLYLKNNYEENFTINRIKIGSNDCNVTVNLNLSMNEIDITSCLTNLSSKTQEVVIYTDKGIKAKKMYLQYLDTVSATTVDNISYFTGYAWGELFGYISFNGSNYGVTLTNNLTFDGYAYSEMLGYISFQGTGYSVTNTNGVLTGYAYGENIGYINFNSSLYNTTFNGTNLLGNAYSEHFGYINFENLPTYSVYK